jgi:hypothetical protein
VVSRDLQGRYQLTHWGRRLAVPVRELARWGVPLMARKAEADAFRGTWFALPAAMMFGGTEAGRPDLAAEIRSDGETVTMHSKDGQVSFRPGPADPPDLVLSGPPHGIIGLLGGLFGAETAVEHGVTILEDARDLDRLRQPDWLSGPVES